MAQRKVLAVVLHTEITSVAWALGLRNLGIPGPVLPLTGMPFDMARNVGVQNLLSSGIEWLYFLDSDVIPCNDAVYRLLAHNKPLISGVYHRRSPPHGLPVMIRGGTWVQNYPANSVIEVDYVGAGCLLCHRTLFERLPPLDERRGKRWFDWRVDMPGLPPGEALSEDFAFCLEMRRKLGIPVLVDTSVQCKHCGLAEFTYNNVQPLNVMA